MNSISLKNIHSNKCSPAECILSPSVRSIRKNNKTVAATQPIHPFMPSIILTNACAPLLRSPDPYYPTYPIYQLSSSHHLVQWCLDHGAQVSYPDVEPYTPLLEYVARSSSSSENLATFKLLLAHGAKLGRRTLHLAAAAAGAGGNKDESEERSEGKMALVRFLVEELGCDVNGMDVGEGEKFGNHYGTPINYVAHGSAGGRGGNGAERVVRYLLEVSFLFFWFFIFLLPHQFLILSYMIILNLASLPPPTLLPRAAASQPE